MQSFMRFNRFKLILYFYIFYGCFFSSWAFSKGLPKSFDAESAADSLVGEYVVIGKKPDSIVTYQGRVTLQKRGQKLLVTRTINGHTDHGIAVFYEADPPGDVVALNMHFSQGGRQYEAAYLWSNDLDNYPRLTGYVYLPKDSAMQTQSPGLESLFPLEPLNR